MISIEIKEKWRGGNQILGPMAFSLGAGDTLAITGPSGVGKSTLLRILAGLDEDFEGHLQRPDRIAMVFQEPALLPWRTARANIMLTAGVGSEEADAALEEVGLGGLGERFPGQMSLGQQRRLSLSRAFSASPELLLMDEPFVSLDPALVEEMLSLTETLLASRRIATVFVTHNPDEADRLATRRVRLEGAPARMVAE